MVTRAMALSSPLLRARWLGLIVFSGISAIILAIGYTHHVPATVTPEDQIYIAKILRENGHAAALHSTQPTSFQDELKLVRAVQDAVLKATPLSAGIPLGSPREPKQLYYQRQGLCFDRSRTIEKTLSHLGFAVRHVFVYYTGELSPLQALVTPGIPSHALTEVLTRHGWLLVDSNHRWIGIQPDGSPLSIAELQQIPVGQRRSLPDIMDSESILREPFIYMYGLYSRHGRFFEPMNPIPDLNFIQMIDNISNRV